MLAPLKNLSPNLQLSNTTSSVSMTTATELGSQWDHVDGMCCVFLTAEAKRYLTATSGTIRNYERNFVFIVQVFTYFRLVDASVNDDAPTVAENICLTE